MNPPIFDGHNDTVLKFFEERAMEKSPRSFFERSDLGHLDLPRAQAGGLGGGFFAIFAPNKQKNQKAEFASEKSVDEHGRLTYTTPLPPPIKRPYAQKVTLTMMAQLFAWEEEGNGRLTSASRELP